jgi:PIN domain nuclease of toxin-antitoxin system
LILLDTHAWVWWVSAPPKLSAAARRRIDRAVEEDGVHVSAMSCSEVSLLVRRRRLELTMEVEDWVALSEALPYLHFVPVDHRIALRSNNLPPPFHEDPADRIIVATALSLGATLVTKDTKLRDYPPVATLW